MRSTPQDLLAGQPSHRIEIFAARLARWYPDLLEALAAVYPEPGDIADRLVRLAATSYAERPDELHLLDLRRSLEPDWFQRPDAIGYAAYTERFADTLQGVAKRVEYLSDLGVTYLHLMPLLRPRPVPNDGGYAVMDYREIRSDLGSMDDLRALADVLRADGISLCLDLVLNHVAREHEWAQKARAGDPQKRAYFHVFPDRDMPDAFERTLPEVFPRFAPGNFTWDDELDGWVWTTFNAYQWDVDWSNPDVLCEYADIILALGNHGVEVFRLDAIAFTWKRLGTNCQNQPEVHALTQALRAVARIACPAVAFKAEAIVGPQDLLAYLGQGRRYGKVSDLAYHNALMVHVWSMLATKDARLSSAALRRLGLPPPTTAWITYVRCHDDIGWAISDEDAGAAGLNGAAHRRFLSDFYAGDFPGSWSRGLVFQDNDATGDKRISGSLASLAGLEAGDPHAVARIVLAHAVIFGFGGLPVIWMGDELGMPNDYSWADEPAHADDNRWVHRPRMPWPPTGDREVRTAVRHLIEVRRTLPQLHASRPADVLMPHDPGVFLVLRSHPVGPMLGAYNMTPDVRTVPLAVLADAGLPAAVWDHVGGSSADASGGALALDSYQAVWVTASA
ncbi:MAG TPA: alpha-amylase family protein [Nocardioidaceae bacterium]|nr:alpha-amylase family protein [Nocardioidaceae bacterium]